MPAPRRNLEAAKANEKLPKRQVNGCTDVTPDGSKVQSAVPPNDRVDEFKEGRKGRPKDIGTSADIPCLNVPRKRNKNDKEAEESKDREEGVGGIDTDVHDEEKEPRIASSRAMAGFISLTVCAQTNGGNSRAILCRRVTCIQDVSAQPHGVSQCRRGAEGPGCSRISPAGVFISI